jgi:hypothetical protein
MDIRASKNKRKPVAEFMALDFDGLRFAGPIDKPDSIIGKTNVANFCLEGLSGMRLMPWPYSLEARVSNRDFLQGPTWVGFDLLEPTV